MGFRACMNTLPLDQRELPGGPRQGNLSRPGYEIAWNAAGNAFPRGEHDDRVVLTIDNVPQKRQNCSSGSNRKGAAGCGSPRDEVRAFTIDDHNRRARSEPPKPQLSQLSQLQAMQAFGVPLDIDNGLCGRRQRCGTEPSEVNRQKDAEQAMRFRDIDGLLTRRHFAGNRGPREALSPRLESARLETIDIDSCSHKRQVVTKTPVDAVLPSSACYSLACEVNHGAWRQAPRSHSFDYFEKTLQAERYAKLLGRPNIKSDKEFNRLRLANLVEQQQKHTLDTIVDCDIPDADTEQGAMSDEQLEMGVKDRTHSTMSTTASDVSCSPNSSPQRARTISGDKPMKASFSKLALGSDVVGEDSQEKENAVPLAVRRIVASLGVHSAEMLPDSMVQELTKQIQQPQGIKTGASAGSRLRAASRGRRKA